MEQLITIVAGVFLGTLLKEVALAFYAVQVTRKARSKRYAQLVEMRDQYAAELQPNEADKQA